MVNQRIKFVNSKKNRSEFVIASQAKQSKPIVANIIRLLRRTSSQ